MRHLISKSPASVDKTPLYFYGDLNVFSLFRPDYFDAVVCDKQYYGTVSEALKIAGVSTPILILDEIETLFRCCFGFVGVNIDRPKDRLRSILLCTEWIDSFELLKHQNIEFTYLCYPFSGAVNPDYNISFRARSLIQRLVVFSNTGRTEYLRYLGDRQNCQYFTNDFYRVKSRDVLLDVGGFDGDSTRFFFDQALANGAVNVSSVIIEPNPEMLQLLNQRLSPYRGCFEWSVKQVCLGDENRNVMMDLSGSTSQITSSSGARVEMNTGDSLGVRPTVIKIDVEGFEMQVLLGLRETIMACKPTLLVAVYHKPSSVVDLSNLLFTWGYRDMDIDKFTDGLTEVIARFD